MTLTMQYKTSFKTGRRSRKRMEVRDPAEPEPQAPPAGNVPRVSRLMALAIRFERLLAEGAVADYAELARLGGVTRARLTQIMNLRNLAPDIQEDILFLPRTVKGRDAVCERHLRPLTTVPDWRKQRRMWAELCDAT
jgi:hypothetical protein